MVSKWKTREWPKPGHSLLLTIVVRMHEMDWIDVLMYWFLGMDNN